MEDFTPQYQYIPSKEKVISSDPEIGLGQTIGGMQVDAQQLSQGKVTIQGVAQRILIGDATAPLTGIGIFMGSDQATTIGYDFRAGDPSGNYIHWDASAGTLTISGSITATSGTIGGFNIGADYIRDVANTFGLASTVSGSDDVRLWAGDTFANRATAPFRVTEAGAVTATSITISGYLVASQGSFGGDGSDGALSITSGTTTVSAASANRLVKNYTSISITSTGILAFSNANAQGTIFVLKSQGNVTITSSGSNTISVKGLGGGNPATGTSVYATQADSGADPGSAGTSRGAGLAFLIPAAGGVQLACGASGGDGAGSFFGGTPGTGGRGGGALYIECAGALDFGASATINASGDDGTSGSNGNVGGGGGGGAGTVVILYNTLTTNAGTITASGGTGGSSGGGGGAGASGGGSIANGGGGGGSGAGDYGPGGGGGGGNGGAAGTAGTSGGTGGAGGGGGGGSWTVAKNTVLA